MSELNENLASGDLVALFENLKVGSSQEAEEDAFVVVSNLAGEYLKMFSAILYKLKGLVSEHTAPAHSFNVPMCEEIVQLPLYISYNWQEICRVNVLGARIRFFVV